MTGSCVVRSPPCPRSGKWLRYRALRNEGVQAPEARQEVADIARYSIYFTVYIQENIKYTVSEKSSQSVYIKVLVGFGTRADLSR